MGISTGSQSGFAFGAGLVKIIGGYCPVNRGENAASFGSIALAADQYILVPFIPAFTFTSTELHYYNIVSGGVGSTLDFLIYTSLGNAGLPYQLIASSLGNNADISALMTAAFNVSFQQGIMYWIGAISNGTPTLQAASNSPQITTFDSNATSSRSYLTQSGGVYGSYANSWPYASGDTTNAFFFPCYKFKINA